MKKILFLIPLLFTYSAFSQELAPVFEDTVFDGNLLKISSFNYYSSSRFSNDLMDKFIFGGEITPEIKDRNAARLSNINGFGGEAEQTITYYNGDINPLKKEKYGFLISFSDNNFLSANIASDLFNTAMYGNANYVGDTMNYSFTHLQYQHYQKLGIGVFEKRTGSSIQISYVAGSKSMEARLNDTWMYSASDSITLGLQGAGFSTKRFYPYLAFQGGGFAIDLNYNFLFESKNGSLQVLNLKINNLGLISWKKDSYKYSVDSTSYYTGFDIQDFLNKNEGENKTYNFIDTLGVHTDNGRTVSSLPIEFVLQKLPLRNSTKKLRYIMGFKTILTSDYFPYIYGGVYYAPINNFSASTRLSYGGFGGLQWGINLNYWTKGNAHFGLSTFNTLGYISKKLGFGRSLNLTAHFKL